MVKNEEEARLAIKVLEKGVCANSKDVYPGYIFVAIRGTQVDGHSYVREALVRGAVAVLVERDVGIEDPRIIRVEDTKKALGELSSASGVWA